MTPLLFPHLPSPRSALAVSGAIGQFLLACERRFKKISRHEDQSIFHRIRYRRGLFNRQRGPANASAEVVGHFYVV